ncbi:hypothetical protein A2U01_0065704, partial [Trifolium medium]|nr:hypothetical protein [Trifolium medium]
SESLDVDALESYADPVTATPYVADNEFSSSEALREAFPAVDVSNLCRDPELELLIPDYDINTVQKSTLPSIVERVGFGEKETILDGDNKHRSSTVMINTWVFNLVVVFNP